VLERGTAERAFPEPGLLRHYSLGGKTGTAYNFTDTWFLGYSGAVTCGVWVGFDKPRTIYRGAFSNEVAMPIWAEIMKATFEKYKGTDILPPKGFLQPMPEICSVSGQLATDNCKGGAATDEPGGPSTRDTTYLEMATAEQCPKVACAIHNGGAPVTEREKALPPSPYPRAEAVANLAARTPVVMTSPTVLGDDPYNSIHAINHLIALKSLSGQMAPVQSSTSIPTPVDAPPEEKEIEVRRAEPVRPLEKASEVQAIDTAIKIDPPPPVQF
jgi:penicillin-binding protein 1A